MKKTLFLSMALFAAVACNKSKQAPEEEAPSAAKAAAPEAAPTDAVKPAAAAYSPEEAQKLVASLGDCTSQYSCDPLKTLVGFGDKASGELLKIATDVSKGKDLREKALHGLEQIGDAKAGLPLFESAKTEEDFILRSTLFKTAGASGGDETMKTMLEHYASDESKKHRTEMRSGLRKLPSDKVLAWTIANYPADAKKQVRFADLVRDNAKDVAPETVGPLLEKTKDIMARHRLANVAIQLGDKSKFDILVTGLKSDNQYDRSDAANMLADVVKELPAERNEELLKLVTDAKAKDQGGLTSRGYNKIIKTLTK